MTTSKLDMQLKAPSASLEAVGTALVDANASLAAGTDADRQKAALVSLAHASYDALRQWEIAAAAEPKPIDAAPLGDPNTGAHALWRVQFDDLRVQAALAEMELRQVLAGGTAVTQRLLRGVSDVVETAQREVGAALHALRDDLKKTQG
jgi:hypothetical protein